VQFFLDGLADTPSKQKNAQAVLRAVEKFAMAHDLLPGTITRGTYTVPSDGGHEPWSDSHVALAEAHARPDLARIVTLMVHTGQRGSDIVRMRWADVEEHDGTAGINVTTQKVGRRLWIPFSAELRGILATWERRPPFFLVLRPGGEPYTRELLSWHWNHERDTNALLEPLAQAKAVLHGLRATCVVRLRHRRATSLEIASMIGMSLPMVERYSRFADQRDLALAAIHHFDAGTTGTLGERKRNNKTGDGR
jgi:integrase